MKEKVKILKTAFAIIFADLVKKTQASGLSFKYESGPIEEDGQKLWRYAIIVKELGYPDRIIQEWKFVQPDNIDRYNMEYNVLNLLIRVDSCNNNTISNQHNQKYNIS